MEYLEIRLTQVKFTIYDVLDWFWADSFGILAKIGSPNELVDFACRIVDMFDDPFQIGTRQWLVALSFGILSSIQDEKQHGILFCSAIISKTQMSLAPTWILSTWSIWCASGLPICLLVQNRASLQFRDQTSSNLVLAAETRMSRFCRYDHSSCAFFDFFESWKDPMEWKNWRRKEFGFSGERCYLRGALIERPKWSKLPWTTHQNVLDLRMILTREPRGRNRW